VAAAAWASLGLVFVANLMLFVAELWPGAAFVPGVVPGGELMRALTHGLLRLRGECLGQQGAEVPTCLSQQASL
jgi:hypothetical protein